MMRKRNQRRRAYRAPLSTTSEVLFEQDLLVESTRTLLYIDELENINKTAGTHEEEDFYFEIYEF